MGGFYGGASGTSVAIGTDRHSVSRALSTNGAVPPIWQKMLDALGLELTLRAKTKGA